VLKAIRQDSEGQRLNVGDRVVPARPVCVNPREFPNLGDPPAVVLALNLNLVVHTALTLKVLALNVMVRLAAV
jgi:hypothetical protein